LTADNTTNATNYPLFANAATGNLSPRTDTGFTYNPSTGALTAVSFVGALTGNASTATNATTATTLVTGRTISGTGEATFTTNSFNGSANVSGVVTLTNSAVIGKVLTGLSITGSTIASSDTILQAFGKLQNQVNGLIGGAIYQGTWNANTNSPSLTSSVGTKGYYYVVSTPGSTTLNGVNSWATGDWVIYNGTAWEKVDNTDAISSFNGSLGAISYTVSGITNRITITGGTSLAPTIDIASTYVGQASITTVGTLTSGATGAGFTIALATSTVSGILTSVNGGTGNGFVKFSGATTSEKTYTLPNANATILTDNAAVTVGQGGTGQTTYVIGDILQASTTTTLSKLTAVATGNVLISGGVGTVSSWGKVGLTTHVTGILPTANGGTGVDNGSSTITLAGNFTTSGAFTTTLTVTGNTNVTLPTSGTLISNTVTTLSSLVNIGTITTGTWNASSIGVAYGGTGATTAATARTNLGATAVGANLFTLTNPSAIRFLKVNADNTVTAEDATTFRSSIGAGTGNGTLTGSLTSGYIPRATGATSLSSGVIQDNGTRVGIGTAPSSPYILTLHGASGIGGIYITPDSATALACYFNGTSAFRGSASLFFDAGFGGSGDFYLRTGTGAANNALTCLFNGKTLIATTTDSGSGAKLQVTGGCQIVPSTTAPSCSTSAHNGTLWMDSNSGVNTLKVWITSSWVALH